MDAQHKLSGQAASMEALIFSGACCRQQSSLLSAMEASSVQPARKASARHGASVGGHAEAAGKGGMPLHTGPAARMAAGVAAIKNQAPVGLETEDGGDDKYAPFPQPDRHPMSYCQSLDAL